jgi:hypothetical protein
MRQILAMSEFESTFLALRAGIEDHFQSLE